MKSLNKFNFFTGIIIVIIICTVVIDVHAKSIGGVLSRRKRVSDQRLAELETLLALARMRGKLVTVPVGFGRVDPAKIGRRRRSSIDHDLLKLKRILQAVVDDNFGTESVSEENDEISSSLQFGDPHEDIED
ncbi:uncharacterized protein LOC130662936 [Microplitis mediator]|uniref:uncharacterized protein LOC130662936 n=1 Tax=Microplitis mediator TaxID=375433 RepID=UPI0025532BAC|nr:uncharacterized protein LOC130662936 [Microplitis mediator]XP_057317902.1 uncharacterized protein LOC130662936 [Microplitis mediator]XP_057317903.1 uncharacterized protein LOC130662936 [Microplitis mediator]XP_057317904.1 uncharacterized protein LOC130662936 [Microplitis mediator]